MTFLLKRNFVFSYVIKFVLLYIFFRLYAVFKEQYKKIMVGLSGLEPPTSCLSGTRSNHLSYRPISCGGDKETRTLDPLRARQVLSQLSYTTTWINANYSLKIKQNTIC